MGEQESIVEAECDAIDRYCTEQSGRVVNYDGTVSYADNDAA